jgi:uncharacterized membrane protein
MNEGPEIKEVAVDRREETVVTRLPGYAATEQVVTDVAAERRMGLFQLNRILWSLLAFLEILLAFRFVLRLIAANAESGFGMLMFGITGVFVAPFNGLVATPTSGGAALEVTTLIAMVVYALIFWGIAYVIRVVVDRPTARSFTRTTREQTPGGEGNVRTTHTTISNNKL